jgi:hypothetical protein
LGKYLFQQYHYTPDAYRTLFPDTEHLKLIRQALWFVLEPLMMKNEHYSFGFYQELIQKMKNRRDAVSPEDEAVNSKLYAICDLAMGIIVTRKQRTFFVPLLLLQLPFVQNWGCRHILWVSFRV